MKTFFVSCCAFISYQAQVFRTLSMVFHTKWPSFHTPNNQFHTHFIFHSSHRQTHCTHSFTTERTSHVCGCFLWPNYVAQSSSDPTGWLSPASTAPTWQMTFWPGIGRTHQKKNSDLFYTQKGMKSTHKGMKNHCFSRKLLFYTWKRIL